MYVILSSGQGIKEVTLALGHFFAWIKDNYDVILLTSIKGECKQCYKSIIFESDDQKIKTLEGTHLWICQSPFRKTHKRKNWYFSLTCYEENGNETIDRKKILFSTMKSPKKGGQHVNTTQSGVRALYPPLGIEAVSFEERSQHINKKIALIRLLEKIENLYDQEKRQKENARWREAKEITRGNPVKVFKGEKFTEIR